MRSPSVFISYSHDSEAHKARVLGLADSLRHDGIDAILDRYETAPPEGWPVWMHDRLTGSDFVLMVCTETYHRRVMKKEEPGKGLGGAWEGHLILNGFHQAGTVSGRYIPLVFGTNDVQWIPLPFRSATRYDLDSPAGYPGLVARLTGAASSATGAGRRPPLQARTAGWTERPQYALNDVPVSPKLFVGRKVAVEDFKRVLGIVPGDRPPAEPARVAGITGLPGVGKSTFVTALPYDPDVQATYPDGVFWMALGQSNPQDLQVSVLSILSDWARDWAEGGGISQLTLSQALAHWRDRLRQRRVLLVIDDVWDAHLAHRLTSIVGEGASAVITSRTPLIAERIVPEAQLRYMLQELDHGGAIELLRRLAPGVVEQHGADCDALVDDLGRLPLALVVAGSMLGSERGRAIGFNGLLGRIRAGPDLLEAHAPADMAPLLQDTSPSVAALLRRSVDILDRDDQIRFAKLSVFAPKPAAIDLQMMAAVWQSNEGQALEQAGLLVDHGILQVTHDGRYQLHALLSRLAAVMLEAL